MNKIHPQRWLLPVLILATVLLVFGLMSPIITFKKFIFIQNTLSILTATWNLLLEGQWFLFLVIGLFSIVFPIIKIVLLAQLIMSGNHPGEFTNKIMLLIHKLGQWSMLDVFVVAVLVVTVKLGAIANVEHHYGLYAYTGAAILIIIITNTVMNNIAKK